MLISTVSPEIIFPQYSFVIFIAASDGTGPIFFIIVFRLGMPFQTAAGCEADIADIASKTGCNIICRSHCYFRRDCLIWRLLILLQILMPRMDGGISDRRARSGCMGGV